MLKLGGIWFCILHNILASPILHQYHIKSDCESEIIKKKVVVAAINLSQTSETLVFLSTVCIVMSVFSVIVFGSTSLSPLSLSSDFKMIVCFATY